MVPSDKLTKKSETIPFEEAAGAVMAGVTALVAIRNVVKVKPGTSLLMNGSGFFSIQFAKELGGTAAEV